MVKTRWRLALVVMALLASACEGALQQAADEIAGEEPGVDELLADGGVSAAVADTADADLRLLPVASDGPRLQFSPGSAGGAFQALDGASVAAEAQVRLTGVDADGVDRVCFSVDGMLYRCDTTAGPYEMWPAPDLSTARTVEATIVRSDGSETVTASVNPTARGSLSPLVYSTVADDRGFLALDGGSVDGRAWVRFEPSRVDGAVSEVCFYVDGELNRCDTTADPFEMWPTPDLSGAQLVEAVARLRSGEELRTAAALNGSPSAPVTIPRNATPSNPTTTVAPPVSTVAPTTTVAPPTTTAPAPAPTTTAAPPTTTAPPAGPTPPVGSLVGANIGASNTGLTGAVNAGLMTQAQRDSMTASGSIHSEYDGQVIEFVRVTGSIIINHRNVTVRFCEVVGGSIGTSGNQYDRGRNLTIEWCDIHGSSGGSVVIGDAGFTAHRNHIWDVGRGINASLGRVEVTENYLHSFRQIGGVDPHTSGIGDGGNGWENAYVARNKVLPHDVSTPSGLSGAIVNYYRPGQSSPSNTSIIEDNYLGGGSYAMYAWGPNTVARNNVFAILDGGGYDNDAGFYGPLNLAEGASGSGNTYSNGDPLS